MLDKMKNTDDDLEVITRLINATSEDLLEIIEQWESLETERKSLADKQKDIFAAAKSRGYSVPTIKAVIKRRKLPQEAAEDADAMLDLYLRALGMR
jgi:uncharacterized protein (UPF0335 family)